MQIPKKPLKRVLTIDRKSHGHDRITQDELKQAAALQAAVWLAEKTAREYVQRLELRIQHGADVEPGPLEFDRRLQMARTRKEA